MRYIIPCILLALTTCLYADDQRSKAIRKYENEVGVLRKQGQAAIKRLEGVFEKEVEKLREKTLKALQEELDAALESKDLDEAVALREVIKAFEGAEASGLLANGEVATEKTVKKRIPRTAVKFKQHHYAVVVEKMTPQGAALYASSVGAHLVRIQTAEENQFVANLVQGFAGGPDGGFWIDGSDSLKEGQWVYSDGRPFVFWSEGSKPSNQNGQEHFVEIRKDGTWNDTWLHRQAFIIEWDD